MTVIAMLSDEEKQKELLIEDEEEDFLVEGKLVHYRLPETNNDIKFPVFGFLRLCLHYYGKHLQLALQ